VTEPSEENAVRTEGSVIAEIQLYPERHIHIDLESLQSCCMIDGVLSIRLVNAHSELIDMGSFNGRRCDVVVGQCGCGRIHSRGNAPL